MPFWDHSQAENCSTLSMEVIIIPSLDSGIQINEISTVLSIKQLPGFKASGTAED